MSTKPVLILGGGSDIGLAIAHRFAEAGHPIQLAARKPDDLVPNQRDIELRYQVEVSLHAFDVLDTTSHVAFLDGLPELPGTVVCVVGLLGDQGESERDIEAAQTVMRSNYEGPASILALIANRFEARGSGTIVGISSVAGDRGRASNYIYGSAKAGFTAFLSGLRNRLARRGVHVLTVKPGFVNTRMTEGMDTPGALTCEPEEVAGRVFDACEKSRDTIYVSRIWWLVMSVICAIPERVFKKTSI